MNTLHKNTGNNNLRYVNRPRVLYADDNEDSCLMLRTLHGFSDIDVLAAHSVKEAFDLAQNAIFDLYLLDGRFPDGSGFELCQKLRRFRKLRLSFIRAMPTKAINKKVSRQEPTDT